MCTMNTQVNDIKHIIAVGSGKGGVGKSTVAANLALALQSSGQRVGILDADIYGPSQPKMLGAVSKPEVKDNKLEPVLCHGLQTMSIGYLLEQDDTPVIWRGPMVTSALQQLLRDTLWDKLDYLIVDLPPGTGDIQLTLTQKIPLAGAVIVTTPQDIALLDARKALQMFKKVNVPVLGVIENMAAYECPSCGHLDPVFTQGGGERFAEEYDVECLAQIPLMRQICEQSDQGKPTVMAEPDSAVSQSFKNAASRIVAKVSAQPRSKFPKIVVEPM